MNFFTRFVRPEVKGFATKGDSLTQQHYAEESDVNWIIKHYSEPQYQTIGSINGPRVPFYGDFSAVPDLRAAHELFDRADASFQSLPADVRLRFRNNPLELLCFLQDPANRSEAQKLGLIDPDNPVEPVIKPVEGVAAVNGDTLKDS